MLALDVRLLTGAYRAAHPTDRDAPEWPPHPARVFAALVDTAASSGDPAGEDASLDALRWLERLPPPVIACSWDENRPYGVGHRGLLGPESADYDRVGTGFSLSLSPRLSYVPVNDPTLKEHFDLELKRTARKGRTFPEVVPESDTIAYLWPDADPPLAVRQALDALALRVARVGHASSLVGLRWRGDGETEGQPASLVPRSDGVLRLRVVESGTTELWLRRVAEGPQLDSWILPCRSAAYGPPGEERAEIPRPSWAPRWWVLRIVEGQTLSFNDGPIIASAVRDALLRHGPQPPPPWWSGHDADGRPCAAAHLAVVALPFVGSDHADGHIIGVALILPGDAADGAIVAAQALRCWREMGFELGFHGRRWRLHVESEPSAQALDPSTWCRPSRVWATATPILLDRHPGGHLFRGNATKAEAARRQAAEAIARACTRTGLPEPAMVHVIEASILRGVPPGAPRMEPHSGGSRRPVVHAVLEFEDKVYGPVLIGAGRYFGLGLLRPVREVC